MLRILRVEKLPSSMQQLVILSQLAGRWSNGAQVLYQVSPIFLVSLVYLASPLAGGTARQRPNTGVGNGLTASFVGGGELITDAPHGMKVRRVLGVVVKQLS